MTDSPIPQGRRSFLLRRGGVVGNVLGPFLALVLVVGFFGLADGLHSDGGSFLKVDNFRRISAQTATVAVAALGMTVIIIAGGIDLSAGTALALCATVLAWGLREDVVLLAVHGDSVTSARGKVDDAEAELRTIEARIELAKDSQPRGRASADLDSERDALVATIPNLKLQLKTVQAASPRLTPWTPWAAIALTMLAGGLCGLLNGTLVSALRVVPFIVTLGTMTMFLGMATLLGENTTVRPNKATQVPEWLDLFLSSRDHALWFGLPLGVWLTLVLAVALALVLHFTVFGRYVFALGSNEATARLCGINVSANKIAVYALAGVFFGVAGMYQFSHLSVGNPTSGLGMELEIIAAVVIGGGSLSGGRGSVVGTLAGAAIMAVISSGCTHLELSTSIQQIILGVIIIAAVAIDQVRQRRMGG